ncbi:SPOR domain-containing protein [Methylococcus sp. EFPC2]|uniref:SPOR domain-containing protein n=1 Tax=Methylococcus sp. EFPC2 TaxID=2812648 RepID=UPI001968977F|nr:SPOR domain-containing protein [Methylococcus sp. EFPC2]QSA97096.1 SPOR domain-containing protein [Methylococcus sp. EFPC2]
MDQQLKQRLIGVTIVVALVVIFVPMLFDDKDPQRSGGGIPPIPDEVMEKTIELPKSAEDVAPKDEKAETGSAGYRIIPLTDEAPAKKADTAEAKPASPGASAPTDEAGDSEPVAEEDEFPKVQEKPAKAEKPPVAGIAQKPVGVKLPPADKTPIDTKKPKTPPPQAVAPASAGVAKKTEVTPPSVAKPKVAPVEPNHADVEVDAPPFKSVTPKPAPASKPAVAPPAKPVAPAAAPAPTSKPESEELTAWVVQTGSFTSEAKAKALAEKLRQSRFAAFVERAPGESGFTYRVQVGPELDRARAEQTQKQIEGSVGIKGIIVPHP